MLKVGDWVHTPRFLNVKIAAVLTPQEAADQKYWEPTYWTDPDGNQDVLGRSLGNNLMDFAAVSRGGAIFV